MTLVRRWTVVLAFGFILVAVFAARPAPTPGPFMRDFEAYWSAGDVWNTGGDPYSRDIWNAESSVSGVDSHRDEVLPFVGPPATLLIWSPLARLPYAVAATVWWTTLAIALLALILATIRSSKCAFTAPTILAIVALAVAFGPITSDLALGQIALLAIAAAAAFIPSRHGDPMLGHGELVEPSSLAKALAASIAFLQPNAALGIVSQLGRNRTTVAFAIGAIITYAAGAVTAGLSWPLRYAQLLSAHQRVERFSVIQLTPAAIAHGFGLSDPFATAIAVVAAVAAVIAGIVLCRRVRDPFARFAGCSPLVPFVAGFFHEHDLVVAFPAVVWCALRLRGSMRIVATIATLLVAIDWLGLAQRPSGWIQSALLAAAAACALLSLDEDRPSRAAASACLGVAAVFAVAASLGAHFPTPVWPDALGPFHATSAATIAQTWSDEQMRTGLLRATPAWAILRTLSLLGCLSLAYAIYRHAKSVDATCSGS